MYINCTNQHWHKPTLAQDRTGTRQNCPKTELSQDRTGTRQNWHKTELSQDSTDTKPKCISLREDTSKNKG